MIKKNEVPIRMSNIGRRILKVRDGSVILDEDLAQLYQVTTSALIQAVKRNIERFPAEFMFRLTTQEYSALRSQIVISGGRIGRRTPPYAFTEHGVAMLSSILKSERAVHVNIQIIKAFIEMRAILAGNTELSKRLDELEQRYNSQFKVVFASIREIIKEQAQAKSNPVQKKPIGFGR